MKRSARVVQGALFYLVWYLAITSVSDGHLVRATLLLLLFLLLVLYQASYSWIKLLGISVACSAVDVVVTVFSGSIEYRHDAVSLFGYPLWLACMWGVFVGCLGGSLQFLTTMNPIRLAIVGGVGGSLSLFYASRLGAVEYPLGIWCGLACTSALWMIVLPVAVGVIRK